MKKTYYPDSNNNRADWWQNIASNGSPILTNLGFSLQQVGSIMDDAAWGVYLYRTLRVGYEESTKRVIGYANALLDDPNGTAAPEAPTMPTWPTAPLNAVTGGIEARRELWVKMAKGCPGYDAGTTGAMLRTEAPESPFDPNTYVAKLSDATSPAAKQVRFKFSKAYGEIDGINLYGRKSGDTALINLGRFTATPGNVNVPLANGNPEEWQFQAHAVKRDQEIGSPSPAVTVIVRS